MFIKKLASNGQGHLSWLMISLLGSILLSSPDVRADHDHFPGEHDVVIFGYDPVAYFTMGEALQGSKDISTEWLGGKWYFVNQQHRDMFVADPDKYMPQYGGYCSATYTFGVDADPRSWQIVDNKLYLFYNPSNDDGWDIGLSSNQGVDKEWEKAKAGLLQHLPVE